MASITMIGHTDQANHQYDMSDFWNAANAGNMPAVSFLKVYGIISITIIVIIIAKGQ
jgi:phospholipase C